MKLIKTISIVLCILISSASFADEFDLIENAKAQDDSMIVTKFLEHREFKNTGLFNSSLSSFDVIDFLDTQLEFKVCEELGFFDNYYRTLPKEKRFTFSEDLEKRVLLTYGINAYIYISKSMDLNHISKEEFFQFGEDLDSLLSFYNFVTYKVINDYRSLQYQKNRNLSKYEDKLRRVCDLQMSYLKERETLIIDMLSSMLTKK